MNSAGARRPDPPRATVVPAARQLARAVTRLSLAEVPSPVVVRAGLLVLDTLGSCLASSTMDFGRAVIDTASGLGGPPESTLIGGAARVAAANAVLAHGTLAHGLDFDDTREGAIVHTGSVAVTTALAVGEAVAADGPAVLAALIGGVEVMCRLGLAAPGRFHARHFHPTAVTGPFAAAAVAGKLHRLPEDRLARAFGICGSQASGIIEYLADGSWTKRLHPGWAGHAGVVATLLARAGFTGPETVLEGREGFYEAFAGGSEAARLADLCESFGREWELERLTFKPYPCGSIAHPYMDCALRLRQRHRLVPERIAAVRCRTAVGPVPRLWEPLAEKHRPPNGYAAKFSLPYLLASMLVRGRAGLAEFTDEAAGDPAVLEVASRVRYEIDPNIDYPRRFVGHIEIQLDDGRRLEERQDHPRGGAELPMSRTELLQKFRDNASLALPGRQVEAVVAAVDGLAEGGSLAPLLDALAAPRRQTAGSA